MKTVAKKVGIGLLIALTWVSWKVVHFGDKLFSWSEPKLFSVLDKLLHAWDNVGTKV